MGRGRGYAVLASCLAAGCNALFGVDDLAYVATSGDASSTGGSSSSSVVSSGAGAAAGAGGSGGDGGAVLSLAYRRPITIDADDALPAGYSLSLVVDHAALVSAGKSLANGDDVRIFRESEVGLVELDRVLAPIGSSWNGAATLLWFRSADAVPHDGVDTSYWLYYGSPELGAPPADPTAVYDAWDDFSGAVLDPGWSTAEIGNVVVATGYTVAGGRLRLTGRSAELGPTVDDHLFVYRSVSGDFAADALVAARGGSFGLATHIGGVMVRTDLLDAGRMRAISPTVYSERGETFAFSDTYRLTNAGGVTYEDQPGTPALPGYVQLLRLGVSTRTFYSTDFVASIAAAGSRSFVGAVTDPVLVGVPLANDEPTSDGWVEIDWFRLRKYVLNEPIVSLGSEQPSDI